MNKDFSSDFVVGYDPAHAEKQEQKPKQANCSK
jgi:hypothetical protein